MAETLHEMAVRMVGDHCTLGCAGCPAKALWDKNDICLIWLVLKAENCEEQIEGLKAWAKEHPAQRYPSWHEAWQSLFPGADYPCPAEWFCEECPEGMECPDCIERPMSKKVAEKLGIKPIDKNCDTCKYTDKDGHEEPCVRCRGTQIYGSARWAEMPDLWEKG